ncbi:MAG TPA: hypothetical protein VE030_11325 [Burkholderiales bacterium]|nr:hypothetical protein [Burkholderiales bacterium]
MQTATIEIDRSQAMTLYRQYKEHRDCFTKMDAEIERAYRQIARGHKVIQALESIRHAGLDALSRPRLGIVRADAEWCYLTRGNGQVLFSMDRWVRARAPRRSVIVRWPGMIWNIDNGGAKARVPLIPVHLRPRVSLDRYHLLFEADWVGVPPDPMLLRRCGNDLWVVVAAWDLTPVERAVMGAE